jgi:multiple sugar transport system permease protein
MRFSKRVSLLDLKRQEEYTGWLCVLPIVLGILIFQIYPLIFSLYASFTSWNLTSAPKWVGLGNYVTLFTTDLFFLKSLSNTVIYALGTVLPTAALGLIFAVLLNMEIRGRFMYRWIYFVPVVVPLVSIAILWQWIYEPTFGILNYILRLFGVFPGPSWLGSSQWALPAIIIVGIWRGLGYDIVLFLAGLQAISRDYYEASAIDGANPVQSFFHITIPLLSPTTFLVIVLGVIDGFQVFTMPFIMTRGGPANATISVVLALYNDAFQYAKMGLASAVAYILFAIILVLTLANFTLQKYWVFYEEVR